MKYVERYQRMNQYKEYLFGGDIPLLIMYNLSDELTDKIKFLRKLGKVQKRENQYIDHSLEDILEDVDNEKI